MDDVNIEYNLLDFDNYKEYLMSFAAMDDKIYLDTGGQLEKIIRLGYRSKYIPHTETQFYKRRAIALEALSPVYRGRTLYGEYMIKHDPLLQALKEREEYNNLKIISTIIFITRRRKDGSEITGYIDFEQSIRAAAVRKPGYTDWQGIFEQRVLLKPKPTHLSFLNSHTNELRYNDSDNYRVIHDHNNGLMFMHKGDHKMICVGPSPGIYAQNATRTLYLSRKIGYVILYDHYVRKKN